MSELSLTLLGSGSSTGVPRIGNQWGACDPNEPRNRRMRCSALVELSNVDGTTAVLIDTSPDLRAQCLAAGVTRLDGVVFTHDHADQTHGIDDLRSVALMMRDQVKVHMDAATRDTITRRFDYCFQQRPGSAYPAILKLESLLEPGRRCAIEGPGGCLELLPLDQDHGEIRSLGFRLGPIAYCNDFVSLPKESLEALKGVEVLFIDALRYAPHPSHANLSTALAIAEAVEAKETVLTNMHMDLDYRTLVEQLPAGVRPGYDGIQARTGGTASVMIDTRTGWTA